MSGNVTIGGSTPAVTYDIRDLKTPIVSNTALRVFVLALENSTTIQWKLLSDSNVFCLRNKRMLDAPLALSLVDTSKPPSSEISAEERRRLIKQVDESPVKYGPSESSFKFATANDYHEAYIAGRLTPETVAERILSAIEKSDIDPRPLRAFISVIRDDVMAQAAASTKRYKEGKPLSPIDGVPVAVKDEMDQSGHKTTLGTAFYADIDGVAASDATAVANMRALGALLIGKTNMHEIGIGVTGSNVTHGFARNPYDVGAHTGGSSSGSAAAVAAGLCPIAIGADGGGSVRIPASLCGIFGLKCTWGRVGEHGCAPLCPSVGHVGPMAATARDLALGYLAMAGPDVHDSASQLQPKPHYTPNTGTEKLRVGIFRPFFDHADADIVAACNGAVAALEAKGATVVQIEIPELEEIKHAHLITIVSEMLTGMAPHMSQHRHEFSPTSRIILALGGQFTAVDYNQAQQMRRRAVESLKKVFDKCDVIATPMTACTAPTIPEYALATDQINGYVSGRIMRFSPLANLTGIPAISIPIGVDASGRPIGFQLMGRWWEEHVLLSAAEVIESAVQRPKPALHFDILGE
eukprot:Opistho-2@62646